MKLAHRLSPKLWVMVSIVPIVVGLDQVTKWLVVSHLSLHESLPIIPGFFNLTYIHNLGAAFGIFHDGDPTWRTPFFLAVPILALFFVAQVFRGLPASDRLMASALGLIVGGAVGNFIDRARLGWVIDFFDFHWQDRVHFWVFNVADSAITVGVALILWDSVFRKKGRRYVS